MKLDRILTGDARKELHKLPDCCVQAIVADPPYFNVLTAQKWDTQWKAVEEYLAWSIAWTTECMRVLKEDGLCFIFGQPGKREHAFIHLMSELSRRFQFHDLLIWDRVVGYNERRDSFTPAYEMVLVLRKGQTVKFNKGAVRESYSPEKIQAYLRDKRYKDPAARMKHLLAGKYATNLLRVPSLKGSSKEKCGHPSQKPIELISRLIACSTDVGDVVLDPFLGSGTTAVVAQALGRRWLGIENNPLYVELAQQRLALASAPPVQTGKPPRILSA